MTKKFSDTEIFCKTCHLRDGFFTGGGSWSSDTCPICGGYETVSYKNMSFLQRYEAAKLHEKWWKKRWEN